MAANALLPSATISSRSSTSGKNIRTPRRTPTSTMFDTISMPTNGNRRSSEKCCIGARWTYNANSPPYIK